VLLLGTPLQPKVPNPNRNIFRLVCVADHFPAIMVSSLKLQHSEGIMENDEGRWLNSLTLVE